ncbi:hypothetical protein LCGC14_1676900 [marine sediment metagenome]|uniref:Uncharacterized protein n=1 Tax=marine sediment metagenome TaxID=412755 RepID=A0A0F9HPU8_9ZZZZ
MNYPTVHSMRWRRDFELGRVVKQNGKCFVKHQWRFCPHWRACHASRRSKTVVKYRCNLFNKDKVGYSSLPECNAKYGKTLIPGL